MPHHFREDARYFWHTHPALLSITKSAACCVLCLCPILWPCLCCALRATPWYGPKCGNYRFQRKCERISKIASIEQARRERGLRNRKRELSVPRDPKRRRIFRLREKEVDYEQRQCFLFAKLPPELRLKIYELVLCETGCVHVYRKAKNGTETTMLSSRLCYQHQGGQCGNEGECVRRSRSENEAAHSASMLSLLQTCRKIYRETVDVLYGSNTFIFYTQWDFLMFASSILPQRLSSIRNIIICHLPETIRDHDMLPSQFHRPAPQMYPTLTSMASLQKVLFRFTPTSGGDLSQDLGLETIATIASEAKLGQGCEIWLFVEERGELDWGDITFRTPFYLDTEKREMFWLDKYPTGEMVRLQ